MEKFKEEKYLWLALLLGLAITLIVLLPRLLNPYSTEDDFLNWYWMHRFEDPALFPNDYVIESNIIEVAVGPVTLITQKSSPLYGLLYQLLSNFMPIILLGKLLVFPLTAVAIYYLYRISERLTSSKAAMTICIFFVLLNLLLPTLISTTGGFQRSFVLPLLLAFLYYWGQGRVGVTAVVLILTAGIYAPLFVLLLVTCTFDLAWSWWAERHSPARRQYSLYMGGVALLGGIGTLLLWPRVGGLIQRALSFDRPDIVTLLADNSRYGPSGRSNLFLYFPLVGRGGIADHGTTILIIMFLALFALTIAVWQPQRVRRLPREFKSLFWASWAAFALAWLGFLLTTSFPLYLPSRYTQSSLLLLLFIFVMVNSSEALQAATTWISNNTKQLLWLNVPLAALFVALFFLLPEPQEGVIAFGRGSSRWLLLMLAVLLLFLTVLLGGRPGRARPIARSRPLDPRLQNVALAMVIVLGTISIWVLQSLMIYTYHWPTETEQKMYAYLETVPKQSLVAGNPVLSDPIPLYSKRKVLLTYERLGPSNTAVTDALLAYYADNPTDLLAFCNEYEVHYLVVDKNDFVTARQPGRSFFWEPYNSVVAPVIEQRSTFVLDTLPDSAKSFQQDNIYIAPCTEDAIKAS